MSRISIDVTSGEHQKLKALAALQGKSIKGYVIERTLGPDKVPSEAAALKELEALLDERIRSAKKDAVSRRTVGEIFRNAYRESKDKYELTETADAHFQTIAPYMVKTWGIEQSQPLKRVLELLHEFFPNPDSAAALA